MSTTEIINRISAARDEFDSHRTGNDITDMMFDYADIDLCNAVRTMVRIGILPVEALEAVKEVA